MARIGCYARVSTLEQQKQQSIFTQKEYLETWGDLHGHSIVDFYLDEDVSGTLPLDRREHATRLLRDCSAGALDVVVVYKLDRLGRRIQVILDALERLDNLKVGFQSATEQFDTTNAVGRAFLRLVAVFAEWERDAISERSMEGRLRIVRDGRWHGGRPPFGYGVEDGTLCLREGLIPGCAYSEADAMRMVYVWMVRDRLSLPKVASRLDGLGIPPPAYCRPGSGWKQGATFWRASVLQNIVTQTVYCGRFLWGKRGETHRIEHPCPAIVDEATWKAAQEQLASNRLYADRNARRFYLLSGLIRCDTCGRAYAGSTHRHGRKMKEGWGYECSGTTRARDIYGPGGGRCRSPWIDGPDTEQRVWGSFCHFARNGNQYLDQFLSQQQPVQSALEQEQATADRLRKQLQAKDNERRRLLRGWRQGMITDGELEEQLADLRREIETLAGSVAAAEERTRQVQQQEQRIRDAISLVERYREAVDEPMTDEQRRDMLRDAGIKVSVKMDSTADLLLPFPDEIATQSWSRQGCNCLTLLRLPLAA